MFPNVSEPLMENQFNEGLVYICQTSSSWQSEWQLAFSSPDWHCGPADIGLTQLLIVRQRGQNLYVVCWQYILIWKHFSFWCRCNIKSWWWWLLLQPLPSGAAVSFFLVVVMAQSWTAVSEPGKLQTGIEFGNRYFWIFENGNFWKLAREIMLLSKAIPQSFLGGWIITGSDPVSRK